MLEAPFSVSWHPVVVLVQVAPEIKSDMLKDTLCRKDMARTPIVNDLFLRLDPAAQLAIDMRESLEAHLTAGGTWEKFM